MTKNRYNALGEELDLNSGQPSDLESVKKPAFGWSASGNIKVFAGAAPLKSAGTVGLQVGFPRPGYYTVQFNVVQVSPKSGDEGLNPLVVRPRAEIIWAVKGNTIRRVFDITDGASVSGTGEVVSVTVTDASIAVVADTDSEYFVSIQVTPGLRPIQGGVQPPTLGASIAFVGTTAFDPSLSFVIPSAPVDGIDLYVPQNCGVNSYQLNIGANQDLAAVTPIPPLGENMLIVQDGSFHGGIFLNAVNYDSVNRWNPVNPGAKRIRIFNRAVYSNDFAHPQSLIGSILFGIEG